MASETYQYTRGSGATIALPALSPTRKWDALEYISLLFFYPLPSPLSSSPLQILWFLILFFILFCLFYFFLTFYKYAMEAHWRPARCHRCYWLAYCTEKSAPVSKCHWPQKMYHPPPFSLLPPFSFRIPIHLFYILLYLIFDLYYFIAILYLIMSRLGKSRARSAVMWQPDLTWRDMTGHDLAWHGSRLSEVNDRT